MPFLVRKVEKGKWKPGETLILANVPGDAITRDMMTVASALSVWQISLDDEEEIVDEGILALVTNEKQEHIETIDVALLELRELEGNNLEVIEKEGITFVRDLIQAHRHIKNLTYDKLGTIAEIILKNFHENKVKRRTKPQITRLLIKAIQQNRLEFDRLNDHIKETVMNYCERKGENFGEN